MNTRRPEPTIYDTLSSEVPKEASPLLNFLMRNIGWLIGLFVIFVLALAGYWFYLTQSEAATKEEQAVLGRVLVLADQNQRLAALEKYLAEHNDSTRSEALFALASTAASAGQYDKAFDAWQQIGKHDSKLNVLATTGMCSALQNQGKFKEALDLYEGLLPKVTGGDQINVNREILVIADILGNYERAITASDALLGSGLSPDDLKTINLKRAQLQLKADAAKGAK